MFSLLGSGKVDDEAVPHIATAKNLRDLDIQVRLKQVLRGTTDRMCTIVSRWHPEGEWVGQWVKKMV